MTRILDGIGDRGSGIRVLLLFMMIAIGGVIATAQHEQHQPPAKAERSPDPRSPIPDPRSLIPDPGWEPIRCWRQASAGAVTIGETFDVVVTCAVYEGDNARVVPDQARLDVASIQLAPFEIVAGSHPPDVRRGSRRFFQYLYTLRIISPDAIGHDVNLPPLTISYRIHSSVGAAATLEGRDLSYLLPMLPIRVLSLVPADAGDIRDASESSFAAVDSLRSRSTVFEVLAITLGALAAALVVLALVPLARPTRAAAAAGRDRIPDRAVLAEVAKHLADVQSQARGGWTDELIARAAGLVRIVAAVAIEHPISQKPLPADGATPEGRLLVRHGAIRPVSATISSATTADDIARARASRAAFSTIRERQLEGLQAGLTAFAAALYRKEPERDGGAFDEAVRHAISVGNDMAAERSWMNTNLRRGFRLRQGYGGQVGGRG